LCGCFAKEMYVMMFEVDVQGDEFILGRCLRNKSLSLEL
jgi:hypothetical protein